MNGSLGRSESINIFPSLGLPTTEGHDKRFLRYQLAARYRSYRAENTRTVREHCCAKLFPGFRMSADEWRHDCHLRTAIPREKQTRNRDVTDEQARCCFSITRLPAPNPTSPCEAQLHQRSKYLGGASIVKVNYRTMSLVASSGTDHPAQRPTFCTKVQVRA